MSQCRYIDNNGMRCKRKFKSKKKYCYQHQNRKKNISTAFEYNDLIGKGSFGCTYKPPLKCIDKPNLNKKHDEDAMKFMKNDDYTKWEKFISEIINRIDPNHEYFIALSEDQCTIDIVKEKEEIDKCMNYRRSTVKNEFIGFFIKYGGITLDKYLTLNKNNYYDTFKIMLHLLKGLSILHKNNIIHRDLKGNNIVIGSDNISRIIDFGLAKIIDKSDENYKKKIYDDIDDLMSIFRLEQFKEQETIYDDFKKLKNKILMSTLLNQRYHHICYLKKFEKQKIVYDKFKELKKICYENRWNKYDITIEYIIEYINEKIMPYVKK